MRTITLSGAEYGARNATGTFIEGEHLLINEGNGNFVYRVVGEEAVYIGTDIIGAIPTTLDPQVYFKDKPV